MFTLNCKGRLLALDKPVVMGIINSTPDSFYSGSRQQTIDGALKQAALMLEEGAVILDIGGQSTRPGGEQLGTAAELQRVAPIIEAIAKAFPQAYISIDTYYAGVAQGAVEAGACMVNDISGGSFDAGMLPAVAALKVPYVCMHLEGTPQTMHQKAAYPSLMQDLLDHFIERIAACRDAGITDVIIDPGFGFSKTTAQNFQLVKELGLLKMLQCPLLLGVSRKSTIYRTLGITPEESLNGTTVLNTMGLLNGANILRVHDVKEAVQAIELVEKISDTTLGSPSVY